MRTAAEQDKWMGGCYCDVNDGGSACTAALSACCAPMLVYLLAEALLQPTGQAYRVDTGNHSGLGCQLGPG